MKEVYIISAVRTLIGSFGGSLKDISATQLGLLPKQAKTNCRPKQILQNLCPADGGLQTLFIYILNLFPVTICYNFLQKVILFVNHKNENVTGKGLKNNCYLCPPAPVY